MYKSPQNFIAGLLIFIITMAFPAIVMSQENNQSTSNQLDDKAQTGEVGAWSLDELKAKRASVEAAGDLDESVKKTALSLLDNAIRLRERGAQLSKQAEEIAQKAKTAPQRIKEIEAELDRPLPDLESIETTVISMKPGDLAQQIPKVEADLAAARTNLNNWTESLKELENSPQLLQQQTESAKKRLAEIENELMIAASPDDPSAVVQARQAALLAEKDKWQAEIKLYEQQLISQDSVVALSTVEKDLAAREVARQESINKIFQAQAQRLRQLEAKKTLVEAELAKGLAVGLPPAIQDQFDINIKLGKMLKEVTAEESNIAEILERNQAQLKQIEEEFALAREQVKYPIHTEAIGLALLEQRRALPSIQNYRRDSAQRRVVMGKIRSAQIDLERQRRELADLDQATQQIIQSVETLSESEIEYMKTEFREVLRDRRDLLIKLQAGYRRLFKNMQRLEFIEQEVATKAEEEARFLDGHLIWIRSAGSIDLKDLQNLPGTLMWIINPHHWWQAAQDLKLSLKKNPVLWTMGLLISFTLIYLRRWARRNLSHVARGVYSVKTDSFVLTLRALVLTCLLAFGWPFFIGFVSWQLLTLTFAQDFTRVVGTGLIYAALTWAAGIFVYELCWKEGIAKVHFKWPESVRRVLRRNLRWLILLVVPMDFLIAAVQTKNDPVYINSLGRLALITMVVGISFFVAYVLRFSGEIVSILIRNRREGWLVRLRYIWYPLAIGVPLLLALLTSMGYNYSAFALENRLSQTIWLVLGLIIIYDLVLRWLFITQRRLAFQETQRKKEAESAQRDDEKTQKIGLEGKAIVFEEPEIQLAQIAEKNRTLLRTIMLFSALIGLWVIWAPVLPALNVLQKVQLWSYSSEVEGVVTKTPITLADLVLAIIVAITTTVAARNLPGLLEIILLSRLPMDAGARYAFATICRYAIIALGIVVAFATIGIKWSSVHWLIAALGVGIGFGLQEVVANFICGLIVLFERPFTIGDTVTIGDIAGTVSRIRIRATTIVDWDRKELIVPNKEFITGRLINWSLSDKIIRIKIPVGIAYGSDTELAEKLMLKVARANPMVLKNPEPQAVFLGFGDNSLNFELRVFIDGIDNWIPMLHKLNQAVDREFREAGVTISFPQRDVHLDATGPLEVKVVSSYSDSKSSVLQSDSQKNPK
jgi:potassium efflux system protein